MNRDLRAGTLPRNPPVLGHAAACLLWLFAIGPGAARAEPDRPVVRVRFVLAAPVFSGLTPEATAGVAAHVANTVVVVAAKEWPFVDWVYDPEAAQTAAGEWLIELEAEPISITLEDGEVYSDSIVRLKHYAKRPDGSSVEVSPPAGSLIVYDAGQPKPGQDSSQLQLDLERQLKEKQLTRDFLEAIEDSLLNALPIADSVRPEQPPEERIVIPLRRSDLQASPESVFRVRFRNVDSASGEIKQGDLEIEASRLVIGGDLAGCVYGQVTSFVRHPISLPTPFWWHQSVHDLLITAESLEVYIGEYVRDTAGGNETSGATVLDPSS